MSRLVNRLKEAREGKIITIPFIHPIMKKYIFIGRNMYHLIGGAAGSGKSAWVDYNYILYVIHWYKQLKEKNFKLKIILRSMERSKENRIAKWVCMHMYRKHGILIDSNSISGWNIDKTKITDELLVLIAEAEKEIEELFEYVDVIDGIENPTGGPLS